MRKISEKTAPLRWLPLVLNLPALEKREYHLLRGYDSFTLSTLGRFDTVVLSNSSNQGESAFTMAVIMLVCSPSFEAYAGEV